MNLALLLPAGLAALAALLVPLLIHLARRSEQRPTVFAALRWLRRSRKPRHRIRFDEWPLLLVRLLLLALLALLLARPVLFGAASRRALGGGRARARSPRARACGAMAMRRAGRAGCALALAGAGLSGARRARRHAPARSRSASLLRELDASLPPGVALTVLVPAHSTASMRERPMLSRALSTGACADAARRRRRRRCRDRSRARAADRPAPCADQRASAMRTVRACRAAHRGTRARRRRHRAGDAAARSPTRTWSGSRPARVPAAVRDWVARRRHRCCSMREATLAGPAPMRAAVARRDGHALVRRRARSVAAAYCACTQRWCRRRCRMLLDADFPRSCARCSSRRRAAAARACSRPRMRRARAAAAFAPIAARPAAVAGVLIVLLFAARALDGQRPAPRVAP